MGVRFAPSIVLAALGGIVCASLAGGGVQQAAAGMCHGHFSSPHQPAGGWTAWWCDPRCASEDHEADGEKSAVEDPGDPGAGDPVDDPATPSGGGGTNGPTPITGKSTAFGNEGGFSAHRQRGAARNFPA